LANERAILSAVQEDPLAEIELANGRRIGDGHPCYIIAEAGSNWRVGSPKRDLAMAHALIDVAKETGCDAVKFQTYRSQTVYVANAGESDYLAESGIKESINEIFDDLAMPYEMIETLAKYCRSKQIDFMSTPFSTTDADAVDPFVAFHKIASYEISHTELQAHLARKGKPIVFSTGASTYEDIDFAVEHLRASGAKQLAILQCTAKYPAALDDINVAEIPALRERYGVPVGLSDHSREATIAPAAAVALGACLIEKHYTLNNRLPGADHPFAVEPVELRALVDAVRATERVRGRAGKQVSEAERELYAFARRGVQATRAIAAGEVIAMGENVAILRPGKRALGAHPRHLPSLVGRRTRKPIAAGEGVRTDDVE
jgi:sialic acid synthase SpsE